MLRPYTYVASLGDAYAGQASALSAVVEDTTGYVVATLPTFRERAPGEYVASVTLDTALAARIRYTWTGTALPYLPPDTKVPTGLQPDTWYPYPVTVPLGSLASGQAAQVAGTAETADGTLLTSIGPFTEVDSGEYEANPLFNSSWAGLVAVTWAGTELLDLIPSESFDPATLDGSTGITTLTTLDVANIGNELVSVFGQDNLNLLGYLRQFLPAAGVSVPRTGVLLAPVLTPGTDTDLDRSWGLEPGTRLYSITFGLRLAGQTSAPDGVPDRVILAAAGAQGQITDPGTLRDDGTMTAHGRFLWSRAETGALAPGSRPTYFITGTVGGPSGPVILLEDGAWPVGMGGPRG